jgi:hypothetical protein
MQDSELFSSLSDNLFMGRPKNFSREEVLEKAMAIFWKHGFAAPRRDHAGDHLPGFYPLQLPPWIVSSKHGSPGLKLGLRGLKDIPLGLGFGKVWNFDDGKTINFYMEPSIGVAERSWGSGMAAPHRGQLPVSRPLSILEQADAALTIDL